MAVFLGGEAVDHYQYLGVGRTASANQIEAAVRLALLRHGADAELTERIMDAWDVVGDPDRRFDYDFWLLTHPSPAGAYASVEHRAAPMRIPELDVPRAAAQRRATGALPPAGSLPPAQAGLPDAAASRASAVQPAWRDEAPGLADNVGRGFNRPRLLVLLGLVAATLGLVTVLVTSTPPTGILLVNGMCWLGFVLIGRLWPWAGIPGGHSRNR